MNQKKQRSKKSEMEKAIQLGIKYGLSEIKTTEFTITFKQPDKPKHKSTTDKPKISASGILINDEIPKEEVLDESDMLMWSTPFYNLEKHQVNGEPT